MLQLLTYDSNKWQLATTAVWVQHVELHSFQNLVRFMTDTHEVSLFEENHTLIVFHCQQLSDFVLPPSTYIILNLI